MWERVDTAFHRNSGGLVLGCFEADFLHANTHVAVFLDLQDRRTFAPLQSQHACKIGNSFAKMLTNFGRRPRARGHLYFLVSKFARFCQTSANIESNTCIFSHISTQIWKITKVFSDFLSSMSRGKNRSWEITRRFSIYA